MRDITLREPGVAAYGKSTYRARAAYRTTWRISRVTAHKHRATGIKTHGRRWRGDRNIGALKTAGTRVAQNASK